MSVPLHRVQALAGGALIGRVADCSSIAARLLGCPDEEIR